MKIDPAGMEIIRKKLIILSAFSNKLILTWVRKRFFFFVYISIETNKIEVSI